MNPYQEIRKVPLDYSGIQSSAYSVQRYDEEKGWKEAGVVGQNYMLLPNQDVKDIAEDLLSSSAVKFELDKEFFNGKNFMLAYKAVDSVASVDYTVNDNELDKLNLGIQFWNSYDGSRSFGFSLMLYRLICTNGMMSKQYLQNYRFRHNPGSEDWDKQLESMVHMINISQDGDNEGVNTMIKGIRELNDYRVTSKNLGNIRHNFLKDIPTGVWGEITDKFLDPNGKYYSDTNGWGLLNSATDVLWHKKKPTLASYNQNATITDGLINAICA